MAGGGARHVRALFLALLGDKAYDAAIALNTMFNRARRFLGLPYWSLSSWLKLSIKNAVSFIGEFEQVLVTEGRRHNADGVICGHIHHASMHDDFGLAYINCGDWVESCTAIAEFPDGRFELITWTDQDLRDEPIAPALTPRAA